MSIECNELLEQHRPKPGEPDLRGFEWHYLNRLLEYRPALSIKRPAHARPTAVRIRLGSYAPDRSYVPAGQH